MHSHHLGCTKPASNVVSAEPTECFKLSWHNDAHAELDWENVRKQPAPKFAPVTKNTTEEDAVDWELTSLIGQHHGHAFGNVSGGHAANHHGAAIPQDNGTDASANAFMAAAAMHAITSQEAGDMD